MKCSFCTAYSPNAPSPSVSTKSHPSTKASIDHFSNIWRYYFESRSWLKQCFALINELWIFRSGNSIYLKIRAKIREFSEKFCAHTLTWFWPAVSPGCAGVNFWKIKVCFEWVWGNWRSLQGLWCVLKTNHNLLSSK